MKPLNLSHISNAKDSGNISEDSPRTPPPAPIQVSISPGRYFKNRNRPFMINSSNSSDDNQADYSGLSSAKSMNDRELFSIFQTMILFSANRSHSPEIRLTLLRKIQSKVLLKENFTASRSRRHTRVIKLANNSQINRCFSAGD